jgi:hypothetical protein
MCVKIAAATEEALEMRSVRSESPLSCCFSFRSTPTEGGRRGAVIRRT